MPYQRKQPDKLSGHLRIWPEKTYIWPDIVRWPAVIYRPATGCSVNLLLFACVALTLEAKWVIRLKNIVIAWSLAMYGKWMNQMLPFMMQANFKHYFNKLWIIFIWLILLSFLLDDRGHFSKCRSFLSSAV